MKLTIVITPECDTDPASGYPCFERAMLKFEFAGFVWETTVTHGGRYTGSWEEQVIQAALPTAAQVANEFRRAGFEVVVTDALTQKLEEQRDQLTRQLQEVKQKLGR